MESIENEIELIKKRNSDVEMDKACIPTGGYLLSTLSLPFIKTWWIRK